jgi:hypothetical protein
MQEIENLEYELKAIQNNCKRIREFVKANKDYTLHSSAVVGELKHRCIALKQTLTRVQKITTYNYFK